MTNTLLNGLKALYEKDSACVWMLDNSLDICWQNTAASRYFTEAPDFHGIAIRDKSPSLLPAGNYHLKIAAAVLTVHLLPLDENDGYLVICNHTSSAMLHHTEDVQHRLLKNDITQQQQCITGIMNSIISIYDRMNNMDCTEEQFHTVMTGLNVLTGNFNCLLKPLHIQSELYRYDDAAETTAKGFNCSILLQEFQKQTQHIFGNHTPVRLILNGKSLEEWHELPHLYVDVPPKRLEFCFICLLLLLRDKTPKRNRFVISADMTETELLIRISAGCADTDEPEEPPLLSKYVPLYPEVEQYRERLVVDRFCEQYHASFIESHQKESSMGLMRIPKSVISDDVNFQSIFYTPEESIFSTYHILCSNSANYRFF